MKDVTKYAPHLIIIGQEKMLVGKNVGRMKPMSFCTLDPFVEISFKSLHHHRKKYNNSTIITVRFLSVQVTGINKITENIGSCYF